jgi:glycosyltransferase involved in cell wall biosynthesis
MKLSISIPIYNVNLNLIKRCINSILNNSFQNFEIIFGYDYDNDEVEQYLRELCKNDQRFILITEQNPLGMYSVRVKTFEIFTGDIITFIDPDDYIDQNYLQLLIDNHKNIESVIGISVAKHLNGSIVKEKHKYFGQTITDKQKIKDIFIRSNIDPEPNFYLRCTFTKEIIKQSFQDLKNINKFINNNEDQLMKCIIYKYVNSVYFLPDTEQYYQYEFRPESQSVMINRSFKWMYQKFSYLFYVMKSLINYYKDDNVIIESYSKHFINECNINLSYLYCTKTSDKEKQQLIQFCKQNVNINNTFVPKVFH